jgi:DNA-binding CsgD family transcriptional regulator
MVLRSQGIEQPLSKREGQICELFALSMTYKEIAATLGISINTVREHVRNIYRKLNVASKVEAVLYYKSEAA